MARVKVLLLQDVPELGLAGDIYAVAGGFARNYLIPRQYAILASKGALKQAEEIREAGIRRRARMREDAEAQASVINGKRLLFQANAGEGGRLYGSVTASDIAEQLEEQVGFEIDRRRLMLGQSLRDLGIYEIELRLMPEVSGQFHVAVVREEESWADAEARETARLEAVAEAEAAAAVVEDVEDELEAVAEIVDEEEEASE